MTQPQIDVFSIRDLRVNTSAMIRAVEEGHVALITKHGKPAALTVPFDLRLLQLGIEVDLALKLFENGLISLKKAARLANMTLDEFMDVLAEADIVAVDYPPEELEEEMKVPI